MYVHETGRIIVGKKIIEKYTKVRYNNRGKGNDGR